MFTGDAYFQGICKFTVQPTKTQCERLQSTLLALRDEMIIVPDYCRIATERHIWWQTLTCLTSACEPHKMDYEVTCSCFPNPRSVSQRLALLKCTTI